MDLGMVFRGKRVFILLRIDFGRRVAEVFLVSVGNGSKNSKFFIFLFCIKGYFA